jgi:hypothetical protein
MVVPFIALAVVIIIVAMVIALGLKKRSKGEKLGEPGKKL